MAAIFEGREAVQAFQSRLKARVDALYLNYSFPVLATIRVGEDPAAVRCEAGLLRAAEATGVIVRRYIMPADLSAEDLALLIQEVNPDRLLPALLLFPLPEALAGKGLEGSLNPEKDLSGILSVEEAADDEMACTRLMERVIDATEKQG